MPVVTVVECLDLRRWKGSNCLQRLGYGKSYISGEQPVKLVKCIEFNTV